MCYSFIIINLHNKSELITIRAILFIDHEFLGQRISNFLKLNNQSYYNIYL